MKLIKLTTLYIILILQSFHACSNNPLIISQILTNSSIIKPQKFLTLQKLMIPELINTHGSIDPKKQFTHYIKHNQYHCLDLLTIFLRLQKKMHLSKLVSLKIDELNIRMVASYENNQICLNLFSIDMQFKVAQYFALLHELRHAMQDQHNLLCLETYYKNDTYRCTIERDAEHFAIQNIQTCDLCFQHLQCSRSNRIPGYLQKEDYDQYIDHAQRYKKRCLHHQKYPDLQKDHKTLQELLPNRIKLTPFFHD